MISQTSYNDISKYFFIDKMLIQKSYQYELIPNGEQVRRLKQFCGCCRFVFNKGLEEVKKYYETTGHFLNYVQLAAFLPKWKQDCDWLKDCNAQVLQQSMKNLSQALMNFSAKRAGFPKFKTKGRKDSCRFPQDVKSDQNNNHIYLPKIGWVRYRNSRTIIGTIKNVTVTAKCGKWYVSIQTEYEQEKPVHSGSDIGIDMGIVRFATLSDGRYFEPINAFHSLKGKPKAATIGRNWLLKSANCIIGLPTYERISYIKSVTRLARTTQTCTLKI